MAGNNSYINFGRIQRLPARTSRAARQRRAQNIWFQPGGLDNRAQTVVFEQTGVSNEQAQNETPTVSGSRTPMIRLKTLASSPATMLTIGSDHPLGVDEVGYISIAGRDNGADAVFITADGISGGMISRTGGITNNDNIAVDCSMHTTAIASNATFKLSHADVDAIAVGKFLDPDEAIPGWWLEVCDSGGNLSSGSVQLSCDPDTTNTGYTINGSNATVVLLNTAWSSARLVMVNTTNFIIQRY